MGIFSILEIKPKYLYSWNFKGKVEKMDDTTFG